MPAPTGALPLAPPPAGETRYQPCRWYDPNPRLAFALRLLYFAPRHLQSAMGREWLEFVTGQMGVAPPTGLRPPSQRWYDQADPALSEALNLLQRTPEAVQTRSADALLARLWDLTPEPAALTARSGAAALPAEVPALSDRSAEETTPGGNPDAAVVL